MSFTEKDREKLEFADDVKGLEEWMNETFPENIVMMHNELAQNSEDYREIAKVSENSRLLLNEPASILPLVTGMTPENIVDCLFRDGTEVGAILSAVVQYRYTNVLRREENIDPVWSGIMRSGEEWRNIVHSLAVFLAIRGKEPIDMFPGKLKSKETTNG